MDSSERIAALRLARSENVGPVTFRELLRHCGSAEAALEQLPELSRRGGYRANVRICPRAEAEAELRRAQDFGARVLVVGERDYPMTLAALEAPPPVIYVKGDTPLLQRQGVAIVGARACSAAGIKLGKHFAAAIGRGGFVIVSGLARGIDAAAHAAAIETGTVAVLGGGIDIVYPPEHEQLQRTIGERGCLVAEMAFGFTPRAQSFPRRNRIISGLSLGVLVVEAARRSGSLVTARLAAEQGREVFAVPGHPLDPRAEGTNRLLKSGATLVTEPDDVLSALAPLTRTSLLGLREDPEGENRAPSSAPPTLTDDGRGRVLAALGPAPIDIDTLVRSTGLSTRCVQVVVLELALAGRIERHGGGLISLGLGDA